MKMLIETQVRENYGAHDWDGEGLCPQYWKNKSGSTHYIENIDINRAKEIFDANHSRFERSDDYYSEYVINWEIVEDDFQTEYEKWLAERVA